MTIPPPPPLIGIAQALAALEAAGGGTSPDALTPAQLLAVGAAFGALTRQVDAAFAPVAAEIARQSRIELGRDSLARRQGFRSPVALIQATTGSSVGEAAKLVQVGEATAPRLSITGERMPAKHPSVAAAVAAGTLGVTSASAIVAVLDRLSTRVEQARLAAAEAELVSLAPGLRSDELSRLLARAEAHLDPDGLEPRHEERRAERSLTLQERDGMLHLTGVLDVETAAPIKTAIDDLVSQALRRRRDAENDGSGDGSGDDAVADQRTIRQMRADALADLCRHAIGCTQVPTGPTATVVVRMSLDDLRSGVGAVTLDGFDTAAPASVVRRMACDLQVIPWVMGSDGEILDWGRARRLFSPAQKLALAERDGGCSSCGAPTTWTHVHHIRWWERDRGPTDLDNGILLCAACHHRIHDDGWEIRVDGTGVRAQVWFIPPPWIDPSRAPRRGGRARFDLTA